MNQPVSPLDLLPSPCEIHTYIGRLCRELALLRRLLRLTQTARERGPQVNQAARRAAASCAG